MKSLRNSIYALGISALSLLPIKSEAGTLAGKVTDMFSNAPYNKINVTLVNDSGDVYETTTRADQTAVEPNSWGLIKKNFNIPRSPKINALEQALEGTYSLELPDGVYALAFTDGKPAIVKPTTQDLFSLQVDLSKRTVPRALKVRVNGNTSYDETLLPKDFDLEFLWTVLSGKVVRYDYDNTTFYVDISPARNKHKPDPKGKLPEQWEIDNVVDGIKEFVSLDTQGRVTPKIEIGTAPPGDVVPGYVKNPDGGNMVTPGYALFFWDSGLNPGIAGTGSPWVDGKGSIISSSARYTPGMTDKTVALNEVVGTAGLHGEPGTNQDLDERIVNSGGSIFLDAHGNPGFITERDTQIIGYHGIRPVGTRAPDITETVVNE